MMKTQQPMTTTFKINSTSMKYLMLSTLSLILFAWGCKKDEVRTGFVITTRMNNYFTLMTDSSTKKPVVAFSCSGMYNKTPLSTQDIPSVVSANGVCWNTTGNPTFADRHVTYTMIPIPPKQRVAGADTMMRIPNDTVGKNIQSNFGNNITIPLNTPCYVRAYIVDRDGDIVYGNLVKIDGIDYYKDNSSFVVFSYVTIGKHVWMQQDLRTLYYRNGKEVNTHDSVSAKTQLNSNLTVSADFNHVLYNWSAVSDPRGIAPEGWHVATDDEWKDMESSLGMQQTELDKTGWRGTNEGDKLKILDYLGNGKTYNVTWPTAYDKFSVYPTNESGFSAQPTNSYAYNGGFDVTQSTQVGFWWTASSSSEKDGAAWFRYLDYNEARVFRAYANKGFFYAIRCVRDK